MGSFNIKCIATGQAIARKDRCRIAVIGQAASYAEATIKAGDVEYKRHAIRQHASKPSGMWEPMTAFLTGRYDDVALVQLDTTPENRAILATFYNEMYREAAVTLEGDKDNRGIGFNFQAAVAEKAPKLYAALSAQKHCFQSLTADQLDMDEAMVLWDFVQRAVRTDRVYYIGGSQVLRQVEMAVVHETSFRRLVAVAEGLGNRLYERKRHFSKAFEQVKAELADVEDAGRRFMKKDRFRNQMHFSLGSEMTRPVHWAFRDILEAGADLVLEAGQPVSAFLKHCKVVLDSLYALKGLDALCIDFVPMTYLGQDEENWTGQRYAEFVASVAAEITAACKKRREE